jgi:hypothetical protein
MTLVLDLEIKNCAIFAAGFLTMLQNNCIEKAHKSA